MELPWQNALLGGLSYKVSHHTSVELVSHECMKDSPHFEVVRPETIAQRCVSCQQCENMVEGDSVYQHFVNIISYQATYPFQCYCAYPFENRW